MENRISSAVHSAGRDDLLDAVMALASVYESAHLIDLRENTYRELCCSERVRAKMPPEGGNASGIMDRMLRSYTDPSALEGLLAFCDLPTIPDRMAEAGIISHDFLSTFFGWCRASFLDAGSEKQPDRVIFTVRIIDEEKRREQEIRDALRSALDNPNEIYSEMIQAQSSGLLAFPISDDPGRAPVLMLNETAAHMFGYPDRESFSGDTSDILSKLESAQAASLLEGLRGLKAPGNEYAGEFRLTQGHRFPMYVMSVTRAASLRSGQQILIMSLTDITEQKLLEDELRLLSATDALTRISNRGSGERRVERLLREGRTGMFCLLDIDRFKLINDTFGHQVGDRVLISIAASLRRTFRSEDVIMRLGGDEFCAYVVGIESEPIAHSVLNRFMGNIASIALPELQGHPITVSLGAVLCTDPGHMRFETLYLQADAAMYECKKGDRQGYCFAGAAK